MWDECPYSALMLEPLRNGVYKPKEFHGRGVKIVNMGELFAHDFLSDQEMRRLDLTAKELSKSQILPGDLLHARRSLVLEGAGRCSLVVDTPEPTTFESSLIRVRLDQSRAEPTFYFYYFRSHQGRANLASIASQTAVSGVTGSALGQLVVPIPPLPVQRRIASILSAYDDLIENNTRRIAILEEMARRIHEEWFVRFRFPGHENVRMVESELGLVPEGWSVQGLYDVADLTYGFPFKSKLFQDNGDGVGVVRIRDIRGDSASMYTTEPADGRYLIADGDILVGMDGAFHMGRWAGGQAWLNQRLVRFRPKASVSRAWLFWSTEEPIKHLEATIVGTTVAHLSARDLKSIRLIVPEKEVMQKVADVLEPMYDMELTLKKKNANLRATRDLLLPKLISGELDVSNLPEPQAAAA